MCELAEKILVLVSERFEWFVYCSPVLLESMLSLSHSSSVITLTLLGFLTREVAENKYIIRIV